MKNEIISEAITNVKEAYVEEALEPSKRGKGRGRRIFSVLAAVLAICLLATGGLFLGGGALFSSRVTAHGVNLMEGVTANPAPGDGALTTEDAAVVTDFGVRLLLACREEGENTLLSPVSVLSVLAMLANGAEGETRTEMETAMGCSVDVMNRCFSALFRQLNGESLRQLTLANSLWVKEMEGFQVNQQFLQTNADCYQAEAYLAPFDESTLKEINRWCSRRTDGEIPQALDSVSEDAVMYLINALLFEAQWEEPYEKEQVCEGAFTAYDGKEQEVEFLHSEESLWLEDENTTGFLKPYAGGRYGFVGLLPAEGLTMEEYLSTLTGEKLTALLGGRKVDRVQVSLPKFQSDTNLRLKDALVGMGMPQAFDPVGADFASLGAVQEGNSLWLTDVIHKTTITVDEKKTTAAAVTIGEANGGAAPVREKEVLLNRPFVCLIVDMETMLPIFLGTELSVS